MPWVISPFESGFDDIDTGVMTLGEGDAEERRRLEGVIISLFPIWAEEACSGTSSPFCSKSTLCSAKSSPPNKAARKSSRKARGSFSRWLENRFLVPFCAHISITRWRNAVIVWERDGFLCYGFVGGSVLE